MLKHGYRAIARSSLAVPRSSQVTARALEMSEIQAHLPSLPEVAETWYDICLFVETFVNPASDLRITRKSFHTEKVGIVPRVVQETWYKTPSNPPGPQSQRTSTYVPGMPQAKAATKFMKMIRSSGTPCSLRISTAFIADPPVANPQSW